jgi:hypothetical protein
MRRIGNPPSDDDAVDRRTGNRTPPSERSSNGFFGFAANAVSAPN